MRAGKFIATNKKIIDCEFCVYTPKQDSILLKDYLNSVFNLSHQKLKKKFNKKFLETFVSHKKFLKIPLDIVNHQMVSPCYEGPEIEIIHECEKFLVLNKPSNIHGHALTYGERNNCLSFLRSRNRSDLLAINECEHERGLLYRLDFVTSGVLIYVKEQELYEYLRKNFLMIARKKKYLAVVPQGFDKEGALECYYSSVGMKGYKTVVAPHFAQGFHKGVMFIKKIKTSNKYSLIEIELKTGVRHQIRAGLSYLGFPIVGDILYGGVEGLRVFLHASQYSLSVYDDDYSFHVETPQSFLELFT